jgi:hypothetical protein
MLALFTAMMIIIIFFMSSCGVSGEQTAAPAVEDAGDCPTGSQPVVWYADVDGDGFGNLAYPAAACNQPMGYVADNTDCDDADETIHQGCGAPEGYGGGDTGGNTWYADLDGDGLGDPTDTLIADEQPIGYVADNTDCDDDDADPFISAQRAWYLDADGDGYVDPTITLQACQQPTDYLPCFDTTCADCDDTDPNVHDTCGGETCQVSTWYIDADGDGYVDPLASILACEQPAGYLPCFDVTCADCDDTDPNVHDTCQEGPCQITEWYMDADGDGYVDPLTSITACEQPPGYLSCFDVACADCDDADPNVHGGCGAPEGNGGGAEATPGGAEATPEHYFSGIGNDYDLDRDGIDDELEQDLAEQFAPYVYLYSNDPYRPASVEWLFQRDDAKLVMDIYCDYPDDVGYWIELLQPIGEGKNLFNWENPNCGESSGPGTGFADHIYIDPIEIPGENSIHLGDMYSAPFYVTVARDPIKHRYAINYHFFYVWNGCGYGIAGDPRCEVSTHEGDWEQVRWVVKEMDDGSFHGHGAWFWYHGDIAMYWWKDINVHRGNQRPYVMSAKHTHASYRVWGTHDTCVVKDAAGTCWAWRRDYTNLGYRWDPLNEVIMPWLGWEPGERPKRPMDLPQGGIINVGEKPLTQARHYFDPSMGIPMPGQEWILYQGRWGVQGDEAPGPGTPNFMWYENRPLNPPTIWKVPDQVASVGVRKTFQIGRVLYPSIPNDYSIEIDWGDGIITEKEVASGLLNSREYFYLTEEHTYTAPDDYLVNVTVIGDDLWGGNIFKVTVLP